jgi:site-specific recombinase XerD
VGICQSVLAVMRSGVRSPLAPPFLLSKEFTQIQIFYYRRFERMTLEERFQQFLREKRYIKNASENTLYFYEQSFKTYKRFVEGFPNKKLLSDFVLKMREAETKPSTCNLYIRGMNSFLSWLHENEHCVELAVKQIKQEL